MLYAARRGRWPRIDGCLPRSQAPRTALRFLLHRIASGTRHAVSLDPAVGGGDGRGGPPAALLRHEAIARIRHDRSGVSGDTACKRRWRSLMRTSTGVDTGTLSRGPSRTRRVCRRTLLLACWATLRHRPFCLVMRAFSEDKFAAEASAGLLGPAWRREKCRASRADGAPPASSGGCACSAGLRSST